MPILAAGAAASAFVGLLGNIMGGHAKEDAAYAAAGMQDEQADNAQTVLNETLRRKDIENANVLGDNTAKANASGFATTTGGTAANPFVADSTTQAYLHQMKGEMERERDFQKRQGELTISNMHKEAALRRQAADAGMFGDVLAGVQSGIQGFASLGKGLNLFGMGNA